MENITEILDIAKKCLNCKHKPCQNACPMKTKVPDFIAKVKTENFEEAYDILLENNAFSNICSTICPQEQQCEGSCVRGIKGEPMPIGKLERFVNDWAKENNYTYKMSRQAQEQNKKVAIIGSGPAGVSCALELAKMGIKSVIFEKDKLLGGILRYGIPDFRLSKTTIDNIIDTAKNMGIEMKTNVEFGKDTTIKKLKEDFDAIFLGIGAQIPSTYKLSDEEYPSIYKSDYFLKKYNEGEYIKNLGTTVVIGGGNVAMDCSRSAIKMGAKKVYILYRRARENMPARNIEIEEAIEDGVEFEYQTKVIKAFGNNKKLEEIECIKTLVKDGKAVDIENSNFKMKVDTVVFAIGLIPNAKLIEEQGIEIENGLIKINDDGMTNVEGVFAGGDSTESKSSVCRAVAAGKKAAIGIQKYLQE